MHLTKSHRTGLFLFVIVIIYTFLFVVLDKLQQPFWGDEYSFWLTAQSFSHHPIPTLEQLTNYVQLNTPLPFILFGNLEYFFQQGIFAGRLLNFFLSLFIICGIGLFLSKKNNTSILSAFGLLLCPYYLWVSGHLYTDIVACTFVLLGFWFYQREQFLGSAIAFIFSIASRQYTLAFPVAIACFELTTALRTRQRLTRRFLFPSLAAASIVGWIFIFRGLAPTLALTKKNLPAVQQSLWALTPNSGLYFLAAVGLYFVLIEGLLFRDKLLWKSILTRKSIYIAGVLLLLFVLFPPPLQANGILIYFANTLPNHVLQIAFFYGLTLLACLRFSRVNLASWILVFNTLIMMKAYPWDRYVLPILVAFWYLKAITALDSSPELRGTALTNIALSEEHYSHV